MRTCPEMREEADGFSARLNIRANLADRLHEEDDEEEQPEEEEGWGFANLSFFLSIYRLLEFLRCCHWIPTAVILIDNNHHPRASQACFVRASLGSYLPQIKTIFHHRGAAEP